MTNEADAAADRLIAAINKVADQLRPLVRKRREVPLFRREPVEIRKGAAPSIDVHRGRVAWKAALALVQERLDADPTLDRADVLLAVLDERSDLLELIRNIGVAPEPTAKSDASAPTVRETAERSIEALAAELRARTPTLTPAQAVAKVLETAEGQRLYADMRRPEAHLTSIEFAQVAKAAIDNLRTLAAWNTSSWAQFIHDRATELNPAQPTDAYLAVAKVFPAQFAAARGRAV